MENFDSANVLDIQRRAEQTTEKDDLEKLLTMVTCSTGTYEEKYVLKRFIENRLKNPNGQILK
ncbi:MAG: hypothetical protein ACD_8C00054G0010 [uncultured bacterium]|nr:MAG: hypothetical protein ACD_8C00054G0010 [uncultured bacterium]